MVAGQQVIDVVSSPAMVSPPTAIVQRSTPLRSYSPDRQRERDEQLREWWRQAEEAWINVKGAKSKNTQRAYSAALRMFKEFCEEEYADERLWLVGGVQVNAWQQAMRDEDLAETTINLRLSALSSFFDYVCNKHSAVDPRTGQEVFLRDNNPVKRVERAKIEPYGKMVSLGVDEVRALLQAIPRNTVYGLRDFALVVTYLYTGRRSSEVRCLRWGDISTDRGRVYYEWQGKGKQRTDELPLPAYNAIVEYLKAAGRFDDIQDEDYIFTALSDAATHFDHVDDMPENKPLGSCFVNRVVKKCARRAGLKWRKIHTHTLRHTAAMLRAELTNDLKTIQDFLNHSSLAVTEIYLRHGKKREDTMWAQVEALIGVE